MAALAINRKSKEGSLMIYGTMDGFHGDEDEILHEIYELKERRYNEESDDL